MSQWIKLHTEIVNDPKMKYLTWEDRGIWMMILALAGHIEDRDDDGNLTGRLDTLDNTAWYLRSTTEEIQPTIENLIQLGMLNRDADGVLYVTHFADRQSADTSTERVRRYRARSKLSAQALRDRYTDETQTKRANETMKRDETEQSRAESEQNQSRAEQNQSKTETDQNKNAAAALTEIGIDPSIAEKIASKYSPQRIKAWCDYVKTQPGLTNPAGYIISRINSPPPQQSTPEKRWYTDEEYQLFFNTWRNDHGQTHLPADTPS